MFVFFVIFCLARKQLVVSNNTRLNGAKITDAGGVCTQSDSIITTQFGMADNCGKGTTNFVIKNTVFNNPTPSGWGNCIWLHGSNYHLNIYDNSFTSNGGYRGGAIDIEGIEMKLINIRFLDCHTSKNYVDSGGAIQMGSGDTSVSANHIIANNSIINTYASYGGAICFTLNKGKCTFYNVTFQNCKANELHGGAISCSNYQGNIIFEDCSFTDCWAKGSGGAISFTIPDGGTAVTGEYHILGCSFSDIGGQSAVLGQDNYTRDNNIVLEIAKSKTRNTTVSNIKAESLKIFDLNIQTITISYLNVKDTISIVFSIQRLSTTFTIMQSTFINCLTATSFFSGNIGKFTLQENIFQNVPRLFNIEQIRAILIDRCIFRDMTDTTENLITNLEDPYTININNCIYENAINDIIVSSAFKYNKMQVFIDGCHLYRMPRAMKISIECGVTCQNCVAHDTLMFLFSGLRCVKVINCNGTASSGTMITVTSMMPLALSTYFNELTNCSIEMKTGVAANLDIKGLTIESKISGNTFSGDSTDYCLVLTGPFTMRSNTFNHQLGGKKQVMFTAGGSNDLTLGTGDESNCFPLKFKDTFESVNMENIKAGGSAITKWDMTNNRCWRPTNTFTLSNDFTRSVDFQKSEFFSRSQEMTLSSQFKLTNQFSESKQVTESHKFTISQEMSLSDEFLSSKKFTSSELMSFSQQFAKTGKFSHSIIFDRTNDFPASNQFSLSNKLKETNSFSESTNFVITNAFSGSTNFVKTNAFSDSTNFVKTNAFSGSTNFVKTNAFSGSTNFVITNIFSDSTNFVETNVFSGSTNFVNTIEFSITSNFGQSNVFLESQIFKNTNKFSRSSIFIETVDFSMSSVFARSEKFEKSMVLSYSARFTKSKLYSNSLIFVSSNFFSNSEQKSEKYENRIESSILEEKKYFISSEHQSSDDNKEEIFDHITQGSSEESWTLNIDNERQLTSKAKNEEELPSTTSNEKVDILLTTHLNSDQTPQKKETEQASKSITNHQPITTEDANNDQYITINEGDEKRAITSAAIGDDYEEKLTTTNIDNDNKENIHSNHDFSSKEIHLTSIPKKEEEQNKSTTLVDEGNEKATNPNNHCFESTPIKIEKREAETPTIVIDLTSHLKEDTTIKQTSLNGETEELPATTTLWNRKNVTNKVTTLIINDETETLIKEKATTIYNVKQTEPIKEEQTTSVKELDKPTKNSTTIWKDITTNEETTLAKELERQTKGLTTNLAENENHEKIATTHIKEDDEPIKTIYLSKEAEKHIITTSLAKSVEVTKEHSKQISQSKRAKTLNKDEVIPIMTPSQYSINNRQDKSVNYQSSKGESHRSTLENRIENPVDANENMAGGSGKLNGGQIAGIVVGLLIIIAVLVIIIIFLLFKRSKGKSFVDSDSFNEAMVNEMDSIETMATQSTIATEGFTSFNLQDVESSGSNEYEYDAYEEMIFPA